MNEPKRTSTQRQTAFTGSADRLLRAQDVAKMLAISIRLVWRLRSSGTLPSVRMGGATRFRLSDVERLIESGTA